MIRLAFALTSILLVAGCVSDSGLNPLTIPNQSNTFTGYSWPAPVVTDGRGEPIPGHPLLSDPDAPHYVQQLVPGQGAEPNVGVTSKGNLFVTTFDETRRSSDWGRTWDVVHEYTTPNYPTTKDHWSTSDPMLWVDPLTDRVFAVHMESTFCTYIAHSDREGERGSWTERAHACGVPILDHEKLMTAPYGPKGVAPPVKPAYPNVLYLCINKYQSVPVIYEANMGTWCAVSFDSGATFAYDRQINPGVDLCASVNGHPAAYPDGTVVVPIGTGLNRRCPRPLTVVVTEDNGLTWTPRQAPLDKAKGQIEIDPDITVTPDGTAYIFYRDVDQISYLMRSRDKFQTWEGPWRVTPKDITISAFAGITSGSDGHVALSWIGTRDPQEADVEPSTARDGSRWHFFVSTVFNAADPEPVFYTQQITPNEDPAQVGCIWFYGGGGGQNGCRNLLDFIDMVRDRDGRGIIAFTDGCTPRVGCTADIDSIGEQSRDRQVAVAIQVRGKSLLADKGTLETIDLQHPDPFEK